MEIFRLDKAIENEKLDLEMAMAQLKEAKEHLSQSIKGRKELAREMNDHHYVETKIEDLFPSSSSNEANEKKQCNQGTIRKEWISIRRSKNAKKRTRKSISKVM